MPFASLILSLAAFPLLRGAVSPQTRRRWSLAFWALFALIHAGYLAARHPGAGVFATITQGLLTTWLIAAFSIVIVGTPLRIAAWVHWRVKKPEPSIDLGRRQVLGLAVPVAAVTMGATGTASALGGFEVRNEEVHVPGLPDGLDGLRIGQLTDVHVGEFIDTEYLARAVDALDAHGVDLQVMTGDLIDDLSQLEPTLDALERTKAPLGMLAILGNHEKWRGQDVVVDAYSRRAANGRLRLLVDQNVSLEYRGARLRVVGVDYPMGTRGRHRLPREQRNAKMRAMAETAWTGVQPDETVLCLSHHPDFFPIAAERGAHLTLAGHTHGGQVGFLRLPLFSFAYEHMLGRYQRGAGRHLYVSAGTGHWLPFRVGIPAEVTVVTLRRA